jgi:hypothetical protein
MALITIEVSVDETEKLLQLLGHDGATFDQIDLVNLVKSLYRTVVAFEGADTSQCLGLQISTDQLLLIHRYFTPQAFGNGGREFQAKLARAFVELERREDIPDIEALTTVDGQEFGQSERLGLAQWEDLES